MSKSFSENKKRLQILESVSKLVEEEKSSTKNQNPRRFFLKYPNGLVDINGNEGRWYEVQKEDSMISMPCIRCGDVLLLRVDEPVCTRCRSW